ncbi:hypothetical protein LEP1GSC158_3864 [Leptospira interrogans serovar Zanoni str. LT2156]|uniref:Uncharacterized protein n=1 Tax=Leptospira interrogans serovar Zanoni str. LT2156 TaxID=1001601 RepID=M6HST4_LEPIR|nr:hypothetical protein LEP1GSC158_3864 [Leptospira interrogans serovar Zanoni str. LT2156]
MGKGATDETIKFAEEKLEIIGISEFHYNYFLEIGKRVPVENKKYHLIHVHWRKVLEFSNKLFFCRWIFKSSVWMNSSQNSIGLTFNG